MWPGQAPRSFPYTNVTIPGLPESWGNPLWAGAHTPWQEVTHLGPVWELLGQQVDLA